MTPEEWAESMMCPPHEIGEHGSACVAATVRAAIAEVREAYAKVSEGYGQKYRYGIGCTHQDDIGCCQQAASDIASAIRASQ